MTKSRKPTIAELPNPDNNRLIVSYESREIGGNQVQNFVSHLRIILEVLRVVRESLVVCGFLELYSINFSSNKNWKRIRKPNVLPLHFHFMYLLYCILNVLHFGCSMD